MFRLHADGRGRHYTPRRAIAESILRVAYRGDWPARLWARVPHATTVRTVELTLPLLPASAPRPLRLAFASDLHIGPTTPRRLLDAAFGAIAASEPDVLLLGGDYVFLDATPRKVRELEARVRDAPAPVKVAVLGNHDLWTYHDRVEAALARAGVRVLVNDALVLPPPWDAVAIAGVDDAWTGRADAKAAVRRAGAASLVIGLAHSPEGGATLASAGVPLIFAGHTHGGHIALPGGRPIVTVGPVSRDHAHGAHALGASTLFVSRGVGGIELPIRLFAPPDIVVATIAPRSNP